MAKVTKRPVTVLTSKRRPKVKQEPETVKSDSPKISKKRVQR